jgi:hypothetical protein
MNDTDNKRALLLREIKLRIVAVGKEHLKCCKQIERLETQKQKLLRESSRLWKLVDSPQNADLSHAEKKEK